MIAVVYARTRFVFKPFDDKRCRVGIPRTARFVLMGVERWPCRLECPISVLLISNGFLLDKQASFTLWGLFRYILDKVQCSTP